MWMPVHWPWSAIFLSVAVVQRNRGSKRVRLFDCQNRSGGASFVAMMQAADLWERNNLASGRLAYGPGLRTILGEREMRPRPMIILNVRRQDAAQMTLIENYDVIETLAPNRANDPLDISVLPG